MPTLKVLDVLKNQIDSLGDEPRLLAGRGERPGQVPLPEADTGIDDIYSGSDEDSGIDEIEALLGSYNADADGTGIDDLFPDDIEAVEDTEAAAESGDDGAGIDGIPGEESFSFDDLDFGTGGTEETFESIPDIGEQTGSEAAGEIEELLSDGFGTADEDFVLDDLGESPEDIGGLDDLGESPEDIGGLDDLGESPEDLGGLDDLGESPEDLGGLDDLGESPEDLGGLDDLGESPEVFGGLDDLDGIGVDEESTAEDIPDVGSAIEGLGGIEELAASAGEELSLDDGLNFDEELGADVFTDLRDTGEESLQFSMDDFGEAYNFKEGEGYSDSFGVDLDSLERTLDEETEEQDRPFSISEDDFYLLRQGLGVLPRNLKLALEELLVDERRNPADLKPIIDGLIGRDSPKTLVGKYKTLTKRSIDLPRNYEKRSGRLIEERRESLAYQLVQQGWPVVRTLLLVVTLGWITGAMLFMWVYRPIKAENLYRQGLAAISVDDLELASRMFFDAWDGWPLFRPDETTADRIADAPVVVKGWKNPDKWLEYARAMRRRKHWEAASGFYEGYLTHRPQQKDVRLEYAGFLSGILGEYERAVQVLENAPPTGRRKWDREYTLAAGDVFLDWAEDDPSRYEDARFRYAKVLETSRNDERAILSMMRYHLRLNDSEEIEKLLPVFQSEEPGKTGEPALAAIVYSGLARYHLARGDNEESRRFIRLAVAADPQAPEPQFVDAQFWRQNGDEQRELQAYMRTLVNLEGRESLTRGDLEMRILTLGGIGRIEGTRALRLRGDSDAAADALSLAKINYTKAVDLYEDARRRNQIGAKPEYGLLYVELGDILYHGVRSGGDLQLSLAENLELVSPGSTRYNELYQAEGYYNRAETILGGNRPGPALPVESLFRRAYSRYLLGLDDALLDFHRVARAVPDNYEARLALAAVLLDGGDYDASKSQYARAIELLDDELFRTGGVLNPRDRVSHGELLVRYVLAWNNLGVARARSAVRGGGEDDYGAALSAFSMASEYLDAVSEDMEDIVGRGAIALRDGDERRTVSETGGRVLLKEKSTYPYVNRLRLLGLDRADAGEDEYLMYPDIPSDLRPQE